jgi:hypothetical protein
MNITRKTELMTQMIVAQAMCVAMLHDANASGNQNHIKEALHRINGLEQLRMHHAKYSPSMVALEGWYFRLYESNS